MNALRSLVQIIIVIIVLALLLPAGVSANEASNDTQAARDRLAEWIKSKQNVESDSGSLPELQIPYAPTNLELNDQNKAIQQKAIGEYYRHVIESNAHQRNVFRWQLLSAKIIFTVVILLVASGIYFAAVQFHHGLRSGQQTERETEFEASMKGIKISSPVLGVIILTISLVFFYLYLVHVYPIEFVRR